jgi:hypothetical protein
MGQMNAYNILVRKLERKHFRGAGIDGRIIILK